MKLKFVFYLIISNINKYSIDYLLNIYKILEALNKVKFFILNFFVNISQISIFLIFAISQTIYKI